MNEAAERYSPEIAEAFQKTLTDRRRRGGLGRPAGASPPSPIGPDPDRRALGDPGRSSSFALLSLGRGARSPRRGLPNVVEIGRIARIAKCRCSPFGPSPFGRILEPLGSGPATHQGSTMPLDPQARVYLDKLESLRL